MLVGVVLAVLFKVFVLLAGLLVFQKVYTIFQNPDSDLGAYLHVTLGGIMLFLASGIVYLTGSDVVATILKIVAGG